MKHMTPLDHISALLRKTKTLSHRIDNMEIMLNDAVSALDALTDKFLALQQQVQENTTK